LFLAKLTEIQNFGRYFSVVGSLKMELGRPFAQPEYLVILAAIPVLILFYIVVFKQKKHALAKFGNLELMQKISQNTSYKRQKIKAVLIILSFILLMIALARPQIGTKLGIIKRKGIDIILAIDTSFSMMAEDIKPNRLQKAKQEVNSLIDKLKGDRIGLIVFAGKSFVQCPLTLDYSAAKMLLDAIDINTVPVPGTRIGDAIRCATNAFVKKERKHKVLILLTDGEDHDSNPISAAKEAKKEGVKIYTVGIGSPKGEPIPIRAPDGQIKEYKKDKSGEIVMSKLDELTLEKIALLTDGKYYRATYGEIELDKIYEDISKMEKKELRAKQYIQYEDRFQYFLVVALILLVLEMLISDRKRLKKKKEMVF
jgi:Ca-activated chloride channel family protein